MSGATFAINEVCIVDSILSVKHRVFGLNPKMNVRRQRLVYNDGPYGMNSLADTETLGGAGVAQDGSAKIDVLLADLTAADILELQTEVFTSLFSMMYFV
jgi:hypothetical protein